MYGSAAGLTAQGNQLWHLKPELGWIAGAGDELGAALAAGDFDGDSFDDLAIGIPGKNITGPDRAGAVLILHGSASGLTSARRQFWHQNSSDIPDEAETDDHFGASLVAGDFNGDGRHDLAIGVPDEDLPDVDGINHVDAGAVHVIYGSPSGLIAAGNQYYNPSFDDPNPECKVGFSLAAADFNGDGWDELVVGISEWLYGFVSIIPGSSTGLDLAGSATQPVDAWSHSDRFILTTGHFRSTRFADLAVGEPFRKMPDNILGLDQAGGVEVFYGESRGFGVWTRREVWNQDSPGLLDEAEKGDQFGTSLAAGDFDGNGLADLAVGVPFEDFKGASGLVISNAGVVQVLYSYPFSQRLPLAALYLLLFD